jgi:protein-histidine pros-kinase
VVDFYPPVTKISALADRISLGELDAPGFRVASRDELHTWAESLERMRRSMVQAMKMFDSKRAIPWRRGN